MVRPLLTMDFSVHDYLSMCKLWFEDLKCKVGVCTLNLPYIEDETIAPDMSMG